MGLLKNSVHYLAGSLGAKLLGSLKLFLLAKLILPDEFGLYIAAITFQALAPIACLGSVETLLKEVPFLRGRGDRERVVAIESTVLCSILLAVVLLVVAEAAVELVSGHVGVAGDPVVSRLAVAVSSFSLLTAFYTHRCAAREEFSAAAVIAFVQSLALLAGVLLFAWLGRGRGAVLGLALAEAFVALFTMRYSQSLHGRVVPRFRYRELVHVVKVGFPITLVWWVYMVHVSLGRICAGVLLGTAAVGLYGFATSTAMVFSMIPNVIGRVTYPRLNRVLGASPTREAVEDALLRPTRMLALVWPGFQIFLWFALPAAYHLFFTHYLEALPATYVLILASYFGVLVRNGANYLIATNHQGRMLLYVLVSMTVNLAVAVTLVGAGWGIDGIAVGSFLAMTVLSVLIWHRAFMVIGFGRREALAVGLLYAAPLLLLVVILAATETVVRRLDLSLPVRAVSGCILASGAYACCLVAWRSARRDVTDLALRLGAVVLGRR